MRFTHPTKNYNITRCLIGRVHEMHHPFVSMVHCLHPTERKMPDYRRWYVAGGTAFFTVVTYKRRPLFEHQNARDMLGCSMRAIRASLPFETIALVLMPDHLHTIWTLPQGDDDFQPGGKKSNRTLPIAGLRVEARNRMSHQHNT
ncbi:MAG: transposase [Candidatus Krumholzibacteriota bacterium]|nr:transposase [Candidatus Krumholzibacteriota bacterium]